MIVLFGLFKVNSTSAQNTNTKTEKIELIVVFEKNIELPGALKILDKSGIKYREGMDSSKGKIYFYNTGPKFILTFKTQKGKEDFTTSHQKTGEIYEIYTPDWSIQKD